MNYLVFSDIHFGHTNTPTAQIIQHLNLFFKDYQSVLFQDLDFIFIAGDVFDTLLSTNSEDFILSVAWLSKLVRVCKKYKISLRVLEGTRSHDRKQMQAVTEILQELDLDVDYKYVSELTIIKEKVLRTNQEYTILYIPDEWREDAKDTLEEVKTLLKDLNIDQVDIAIMHGCFPHQLPIEAPYVHDPKAYLDIVRYYIHIGHIHISSVYERILAQGSFDRLAHNEEDKKGAIYTRISSTGETSYTFLENKRATVYKTIALHTEDETEVYKILDTYKDSEEIQHIRFTVNHDSLLQLKPSVLKKKYPLIKVKLQRGKKDTTEEYLLPQFEHKYDSSKITDLNPDNLKGSILKIIKQMMEVDEAFLKIYHDEYDNIERIVNGI